MMVAAAGVEGGTIPPPRHIETDDVAIERFRLGNAPDAQMHVADDFVRRFIGEDRALRRLALRTLADAELAPLGSAPSEPGDRLERTVTVRNAVSRLIESGATSLVVVDGDREVGLFTLDVAEQLL